eukprot:m.122244 g.122244  ORF g.122244 m.122244 type:complete len:786 (+) comp16218_c2_seq1:141-2498(+)
MSHGFRRLMHKFGEEAALRDCLPEIKDVSKANLHTIKQRTEAAREVAKWGKDQDDEIARFLSTMEELETELNTHATLFVDTYNGTYYTRWKEILKDRHELRDVIQAQKKAKSKHEKAQKEIEHIRKRMEKYNDPKLPDSLHEAETELAEAQQNELKANQQVRDKIVEVQREMHEHIRNGYYHMHDARMTYYRQAALVSEKALAAVERFQSVRGTGVDGDFVFEPFASSVGPNTKPVWHKGDEYFNMLREQVAAAQLGLDQQMGKMRSDMETEILQLRTALDNERDMSKRAVRDALNSGSFQLNRELLQIVLAIGSQNVADASQGIERDIVEFLSIKTREAIDATMNLAESPITNLPILARTIFGSVFSAVGAAYTLDSGSGHELFKLARNVARTAQDLFDTMIKRANEDPSGSTLVTMDSTLPLVSNLQALSDFASRSSLRASNMPVENAVTAAQQSIMEALDAIASMKDRSEKNDGERARELNMNILNSSQEMFTSAKSLIDGCVTLHGSMQKDHGELAESEYKLRIRKLTTALNDAVNNIISNTPVWIECARQVTKNSGKFEELQVTTKDISACSAQLLAFARTSLTESGKDVEAITRWAERLQNESHAVIAAVREAHQHQLASAVLDETSNLSETQAKKMIMASQISIQKLEAQLEKERDRLMRLRRIGYSEEQKNKGANSSQVFTPMYVPPVPAAPMNTPVSAGPTLSSGYSGSRTTSQQQQGGGFNPPSSSYAPYNKAGMTPVDAAPVPLVQSQAMQGQPQAQAQTPPTQGYPGSLNMAM